MTKEQLDNLIYFTFHFHQTMDIKGFECDRDYLIEKWNKYIGVKPKSVNLSFEFFSENMIYFHLNIRRWFTKWDKKGEHWNEILPVINFINEINLLDPVGRRYHLHEQQFTKQMTPEDLVMLFNKHIGDEKEINKKEYNSLHQLIRNKVTNWKTKLQREYNLMLVLD